MPRIAKAYIALILCSGTAILLFAAGSWSSENVLQFLVVLGFAALSSTLKVRIPGIEATMSPNFVFLLFSMVFWEYSRVIAIALVAGLVQSVWAAKPIRLVQVTFSTAALMISAAIAFQSSLLFFGPGMRNSPVAFVILAGSLYLAINTALVSTAIGLVDGKSLAQVGRTCFTSVFPYFTIGILFAALVSGTFSRPAAWRGAMALFPVVFLGYLYSLNRTTAAVSIPIRPNYEQ
jgi:hypothetical protein